MECVVDGCDLTMIKYFRKSRNQYYLRCYGTGNFPHPDVMRSCTLNSVFYQRRIKFNNLYMMMIQYFQNPSLQFILESNAVSRPTVTSVVRDLHLLMENNWMRYNDNYLLGSDPEVDHIQIDESKFGKQKHNRGSRREGVWVLGIVEALAHPQKPGKYKKGRSFFCTVPNRTHHTLIPIIVSRCAAGSVIRSDDWAAYSSLHPGDVRHPTGYSDNRQEYTRLGLHFRRHEVVNHSVGFATIDQVRGNRTVGLINTNLIEGMWTAVKNTIKSVYRTEDACPGKLLEFLWRQQNKSDLYV